MVELGSSLEIVRKMGTVLPLIVFSSHLNIDFFSYFIFGKGGEEEKCVFSNFQLYALILYPSVGTFVSLLKDQDVEDINQLSFLQLYIGASSDAQLIWGG